MPEQLSQYPSTAKKLASRYEPIRRLKRPEFFRVEFALQRCKALNTTDAFVAAALKYRAQLKPKPGETIPVLTDRELARWLRLSEASVNRSRRKLERLTAEDLQLDPSLGDDFSKVYLADVQRLGTRAALLAVQTAGFLKLGICRRAGEYGLVVARKLGTLVGWCGKTVCRYLAKLASSRLDVRPKRGRAHEVRVLKERERKEGPAPAPRPKPQPKALPVAPPSPRDLAPHAPPAWWRELEEKADALDAAPA